jgi:hypothetical protein
MLADEIKTVIFCDDIRKEITNKDILIGVYAGDIVVPSFPTPLALALWIEIDPKEVGTRELIFRVIAGKAEPFQFGIGIETITLGAASLLIPPIPTPMDSEGEITLEIRDGEEWRLLKRKRVKKGLVPNPLGLPPLGAH